jgi:para-nitrobenzyl esterase
MYTLGDNQEAANEFNIKYGSDFYRIFNTQLSAEKMDENYKSDIYICQINYGGDDSATKIDSLGSFHGIFVPMLNSAHSYGSFYDFDKDGYKNMSVLFNQYLKSFIYTGNPNGDETETEWTPWTLDEKNTMVFDADETTKEATAVIEDVYKTNADIIAEMDADTTLPNDVKEGVIQNILNGRWFSADLDAHYGNADLWAD